MKLAARSAEDYEHALKALLPPGAAWDWPQGGFGSLLLTGLSLELARVGDAAQVVMDAAIERHRPKFTSWHIDKYLAVAQGAAGDGAADIDVRHRVGPFRVGSVVGDRVWSSRGRYVLLVRYDSTTASRAAIVAALLAFKQSHVVLWLFDVGGEEGETLYA